MQTNKSVFIILLSADSQVDDFEAAIVGDPWLPDDTIIRRCSNSCRIPQSIRVSLQTVVIPPTPYNFTVTTVFTNWI